MSLMRVRLTREVATLGLSYREYVDAVRRAVVEAELPVRRAGKDGEHPAIATGHPLAPTHTSRCEYLDLTAILPITASAFSDRLAAVLPQGIGLRWVGRLPEDAPSLKASIRGIRYAFQVRCDATAVERFLAARQWPLRQTRKERERVIDLKRNVSALRWEPGQVIMEIDVREEGMPKPEEALASVFGVTLAEALGAPTERIGVRFDRLLPPRRKDL